MPAPVLLPFSGPVVRGRFLGRRKRFFIDIELDDGARAVAHTANTGAMTGLLVRGAPALLTRHDGKGRAFPLELEALRVGGVWVSVNTIAANAFAARAVASGLVPSLARAPAAEVRREVTASPRSRSRFDLAVVDRASGARTFVEVKSVTLRRGASAMFPDAVTARGAKHLRALARLAAHGDPARRAAILYVVKLPGCADVRPAADIDPTYARALRRAARDGVTLHAIVAAVRPRGLAFGGALPVVP